MQIEDFRRHAHRLVDWMADYLAEVERYPVRSQQPPGALLARLPAAAPDAGEPMERIFEDFQQLILPGITHWQHPRFFAYFPANSSPPAVLAEMLTATLAAQCMLWETSPAAAELEARMMQWLRALIGLPEAFVGSIQDSASTATLLALIAARERASGGRAAQSGLAAAPPLTLYTSTEAHSSVEKAARIAGIGAQYVRAVAVDADFALDPDGLRAAIRKDRAAGLIPACIVGSFGATGVGAIDPIAALGEIAREEDLHLHVDAAWAGSALVLPEVRSLLGGLERVDSFVFNPHKWLLTNFDCSAFFMRDPARLARALSLTPTYLESRATGLPEYRDWSVALGRRFRALKLWFVLRSYGRDALQGMIRRHLEWTRRLAGLIRGDPRFELVTGPKLALLTFRLRAPDGETSAGQLDALNERLLQQLNDGGRLYLTRTRVRDALVIRFVIGQTYTEWHHIEEGWCAVQEEAARLLGSR